MLQTRIKSRGERGKKMGEKAIKGKSIKKVLSCFLVFAILMSTVPVSTFALDGNNSTGNVSNRSNEPLLEKAFTENNSAEVIIPLFTNNTTGKYRAATWTEDDNSGGDCAPIPEANMPEIYLNDTNATILPEVSNDTDKNVSALGCNVYVKIDDDTCVGYEVYVDGVYKLTEGEGGTPDGYCAFYVTAGTHTIEIRKNGCSASITHNFLCGHTYRWISMPDYWCECNDQCDNPPTVSFDKSKYYEGDTVHATVSTIHSSVYYKIKDCSGTIRESGYTSNGGSIYYTIPSGASECCYWEICFYWDEGTPPLGPLGTGGEVTTESYQCSKCYSFYVCPETPCDVYVIIDDDTCVGYEVYVDGVYKFTEGQSGTPDGYCAFYVSPGTHKFELRKNGCSASKSWDCQCGTVYRWISMPDYWCNCNKNCPSDVKFIGTATTDELTGWVCYGTYYCDVIVDKIISDPDNSIHVGSEYTVGYGSNPKYIKSGDKIEVDGSYYHSCGPLNQMGRICGDVQKILPDLVIEDITWATGTVCLGETITFTVTIKNIGKSTADPSTVKYYINNQYIDFDNIPSLSSGATSTRTFTWTASSCGNVLVKAIADANSDVQECYENNNVKQESIKIDGPDLIIPDITLPTGPVCLGKPVTITLKVKNQGECTAGASTVKYYVDNKYIGYDSIPVLGHGSTSTQTFTWTASSCGNVPVKAVADANSDVQECYENNNEKQKSIEIDGPDLIIQDITWPTGPVCLGKPVTIIVKVKNQGGCTTGASTVKYYINNQYIDFDNIPSLSSGATSTRTFTWTASSCGNVPVKAIADANNNVKECDENNNEKRKSIEVNGPDLIIQNITLPSGNIWLGNTVNIEVTTKNIGKCPAEGPFTVTLYLDSQERSVTVNNLEAGDTNILSFEWTPDTCGIFNIKAAADTGDNVDECDEGNNECTGTVKVVQEIEIYDLSPADSVIISSNDVVFSWKTSVESSAELYIKSEDEGEFTKITGESGLSHVVNITLDRNKNYTWYAKSCGYDKCVESQVRSFYIDNGIVFLQNEYVFNIERDYNQQVKISVKNSDNEPHDLLLSASNPYEDIFLGFVGEGSMDRIITLYPDEVKDIAFVIHTQDAMLENYTISINLTNIGTENITDCAVAHLNVRWPNINFGVEEVSADPLTLLKTVRVINNGDKLTDLSITVDEGLENKIIMQPSLSHYTLERGVDIKISPSWSEGVGVIQGNLIIEAAGETKELFLDFSCPEGKEIHEVTLEHPLLYYDLKGTWCINCGHVEDTFELPAGVTAENVIFALIGLHLNAGSSQTTSYDVNIGINDHTVGTLSNVIPKGYYEFDIDSSYLNYATTETATNKYTLDTNMNPGYLTSLSNVRVVICLDDLKLYICAEDEAEAYNIAWGLPYIEEQSEDISVEIISPEEGSELEPGETLIKAIVTGDNDGKQLCRVRATFNNSDDEIVLLDDGLHDDGEAGDDIYANTWNAEVGDYEITVTAKNCKAEGNDIVHVSVDEPLILPVPYYNQGHTKWCLYYSFCMLLRYNNCDVKPWEIADYFDTEHDDSLSKFKLYNKFDHSLEDFSSSRCSLTTKKKIWGLLGSVNTEDFDNYIKESIDTGQPVLTGFSKLKHMIVAVGYDSQYIYLSDPSGAITQEVFNNNEKYIAVPVLWSAFNEKIVKKIGTFNQAVTLKGLSNPPSNTPKGSIYLTDYANNDGGGLYFENPNDCDDKGALRFDGKFPDGYRIVKVGDPSIERTPTKNDIMSLGFNVANPTSTQRDYTVKSSFINSDTGIIIDELSSVWDLSVPPHSTDYKGSSYSNQLSDIDPGAYTLVIKLFDDADTELDSLQFDYKIDSNVPNLIVTGDLPYYDEPLQVFFKGTDVYDGLQQPQVSVQNPGEYTYIVEYWNDTNNNLVIDEGDQWEKEPTFEDTTTSESEFDLLLQDFPIGLYRVKIDGTDYVSNNFFVIFNPLNSRLSPEYKYWMDEESGYRDCSGMGLTGIPYIICKIMFTLKPDRIPTNIRNHDGEMLMIMASNWREHHINIINEEEYIIEEFNTFLLNSMTMAADLTPTPSPVPPEDIIEYVNDIKSGYPPIGDCDCFAVFLVALGRTSGIPSRMVFANGDHRFKGPGKWGHGWVEMYYNGEWHVWDPYNRLSACGSYGSNYTGYANCLLRESTNLTKLNFIVDEHNLDRSPDYGVTLPEAIISSIKCPANLHAYDSQGRHVGVNELGGIDLEIPSAYYTGPDSKPESIMILNQSEDITFKVGALDVGEFNFTLTQSIKAKTTTLTYSNVSIIQTTEATVDVSEANPNYLMEIDYDGDGTTDYTIEPDSVETPGQISYSIQLHSGWNLISLPIMPDDSDVLDVMSSVDENWNSVWSYEAGNWKRYDLTGPGFLNDLTTMEPGKGYWINMKSDDTLSVSGSEPMVKSIPLSAGWNLVGYNSLSSMSTTDAMSSVAGNWNSVWSYENGNWKRYDLTGPDFLNDLTTMEPGKGYWIDMKSSDTWSLGA